MSSMAVPLVGLDAFEDHQQVGAGREVLALVVDHQPAEVAFGDLEALGHDVHDVLVDRVHACGCSAEWNSMQATPSPRSTRDAPLVAVDDLLLVPLEVRQHDEAVGLGLRR
jgi:hypothetical protein